jgi:very-short-patch-repair endonuclease
MGIPSHIKQRARRMRKEMTDAERAVWMKVRGKQLLGYGFRRQHPIGNFIVDFVCIERGIIVELDGGQHSEQSEYDAQRTAWLEGQGYRVLRFWNHEALTELDAVVDVIAKALVEGCR